jgi:two-component system, cell cycle sensor histidine kinase and response regulator CckA
MDDRVRILLVEAEPEDAALILRELERAPFATNVRRVETREELLRELTEFKPTIVLAGDTLPQFSAIEALGLVREHRPEAPFLLITGSHSEEVTVQCMREGADDYVPKAGLKRLPNAIEKTLQKKAAERERELTEAAFRRSEQQFRVITENTRDLICLLDPEMRFIYASPSYKSVLDQDTEGLLGGDFLSLVHADDLARFTETLDEARFFREGRTVEARLRSTGGHWFNFESVISFIFHENGHPQRALVVSRDTTERKRVEREIRKLAAFPQFNPNPVLEFTADGTLTYFNDAATQMAQSLKKNHPQTILPLNTANIVRTCLATGQSKQHFDITLGGRTLSWSFFPVVSNRVVHCYAEDITESLNMEAQLRQALKMESVGQLAAGVAHDFNNILTVIQGHAGLLLSDPSLPQALTDSTRQITQAAERAANLTRQLLMFSRKQIMQPQLLDLNEVVHAASQMLRTLLGEHINLRKKITEGLPAINADHGMVEQIIFNLAANARDAMPRGGELLLRTYPIEIDEAYVQTVPEARPGYFVCLSVSDTGHGMSAETLEHIFEPFFTTKEVGKGTGLGLATVYGIVKQHQGWIEVDSAVGQGTTFRIFLAAVSKPPLVSDASHRKHAPGGSETILVVEDEPALRDLVTEILEKKGYRVLAASTGLKALTLWQQRKQEIKLLFTDMMMPEGVSGLELAERLLSDRPDLKVIYSSGYSLDVVSPDFVIKDGLTFLQKPYDPETLAQVVRDSLNG